MAHDGSVLVSSEVSASCCSFAPKIITKILILILTVVMQYLKRLVELGNTKMQENLQRIER